MLTSHDRQSNYLCYSLKVEGGHVTFGDNSKGKIISIGNIGGNPFPLIENIFLVDKLKYNMLSISQLCDKGYKVNFWNG